MKRNTILFDINETVLNLDSLKPVFGAAFGDERVLTTWFAILLHTSTVCALTNVKTNFAILTGNALDVVAARLGTVIKKSERDNILHAFTNLKPHSDIEPALTCLLSAGYRTVAFSNSSFNLISTQIANAGLMDYFNEIVSVEEAGGFKPDPMVYKFVANKLNQPPHMLRLVATHDWDTHGAMSIGMTAAYIDRSNVPYNPQYLRPDVFAGSMIDVVNKIIEMDRR